MEGKDHQKPSITDYFHNKREQKQTRAKQLQDDWELMKVCVQYIKENEDPTRRKNGRECGREERLARMRKKKSEMQRKNEIVAGDEKYGEKSQLAGNPRRMEKEETQAMR